MGTCCTICTLSQPSHHSCPQYTPAPDCEGVWMIYFSLSFFILRNFSTDLCLSVSLARGLWLSRIINTDYKTLAEYRLINSSVRQSENSIFFFLNLCMHLFIYFALFFIFITTYCIFYCRCCILICTMLMCMCSQISLPLSVTMSQVVALDV